MKILMLVNWKIEYCDARPSDKQPPDYYVYGGGLLVLSILQGPDGVSLRTGYSPLSLICAPDLKLMGNGTMWG